MALRGTSRAIVIPRESFRKSTLAYSRPIKSRSRQKLPTPQPRNRGSPRRRMESRARRVGLMNNSLAWSFPVLWRLTTGWRRFSGAAGSAFDPLRGPRTNRPIGVAGARVEPVVSRIQRQHDRHFRPVLPIDTTFLVLATTTSLFRYATRQNTLCRRAAAQRLRDANTARRQAGGMPLLAATKRSR